MGCGRLLYRYRCFFIEFGVTRVGTEERLAS